MSGSIRVAARLDALGMTASTLCAVHCALMPLLVGALSLAGIAGLASEATEWAFLLVSLCLAGTSLSLGHRQHGSLRALSLAGLGAALLAAGRGLGAAGSEGPSGAVLAAGGLSVAAAHLWNRRLCRACTTCATSPLSASPTHSSIPPTLEESA
jgi:hypothetical protein